MARLALGAAALAACFTAAAQRPDTTNYDEAKVPRYTLPDPLAMRNGERVRDAKAWTSRRRPEILELYRSEVFGRSPARPRKLDFEVASVDQAALGGKAVRKQVTVWFAGRNGGPKMDILIYLPAGAKKPAPLFVGLGFLGNDSVSLDPGVKPGEEWAPDPITKKMVKHTNAESARGAAAQRWQLDMILGL